MCESSKHESNGVECILCFLDLLTDVFMEKVFFKECIITIAKSTYIYYTAAWCDPRNEFALETEVF